MDRYLTREEVIDRLCWYAQLDAEHTKMAQSNKKDKKISFYQYSYDEMMKLYDNGEYKAAKAASLHSLFILCDIDFLSLKRNAINTKPINSPDAKISKIKHIIL